MAIAKRMTKRGFTLIELMIVVVIIGVLAALAIYGVNQYVSNAKTAEARTAVGRMGKDAMAVYEGEHMVGETVVALGGTRGVTRSLCGPSRLVPLVMVTDGTKYQPGGANGIDFNPNPTDVNDRVNGWTCLRFTMNDPILFQYGYNMNQGAQTAASITPAVADDTALAFGQTVLGGRNVIIGQFMQVQTDGGRLILTLAPALAEGHGAFLASGNVTAVQ